MKAGSNGLSSWHVISEPKVMVNPWRDHIHGINENRFVLADFEHRIVDDHLTDFSQSWLCKLDSDYYNILEMSDIHMGDMPTSSLETLGEIPLDDDNAKIQEARLWRDDGWTASVIKNEDDDGWAVAMIKDGEAEPALVGPWTMGRDKKNPKPLDAPAFATLVKTASEVIRRHEQQLHAMLHKSVNVTVESRSVNVTLDIIPDEDDPYALLTAHDDSDSQLAQVRVAPTFKLNATSAYAWIESGFRKPEK